MPFLYLPPLGTVLRQSGKSPVDPTDALVAALPVQRRLAPDEVTELVASYRNGADVMDMAKRYRVNRTTVMAHLRREGVPPRHPGAVTPENIDRAVRLYEAGESAEFVAGELQVAPSTVRRVLKKAGVTMRPRGRRRGRVPDLATFRSTGPGLTARGS